MAIPTWSRLLWILASFVFHFLSAPGIERMQNTALPVIQVMHCSIVNPLPKKLFSPNTTLNALFSLYLSTGSSLAVMYVPLYQAHLERRLP